MWRIKSNDKALAGMLTPLQMFMPLIALIILLTLCSGALALDICIDKTAPTAPTGLSIADTPYDSDGTITLTWNAATDEPACSGIDHYNIYRKANDGSYVLIGQTSSSSNPAFSFTDSGLTQGIKYYYYITAIDKVSVNPNEGAASSSVSTTIGTAPITPPENNETNETDSNTTNGNTTDDDTHHGGGGGGGGSSGGTTNTTSDWNCANWTTCLNGKQTQLCTHTYLTGVTTTNTRTCTASGTGSSTNFETNNTENDTGGHDNQNITNQTQSQNANAASGTGTDGPTGAVIGARDTSWIYLAALLAFILLLFLLLALGAGKEKFWLVLIVLLLLIIGLAVFLIITMLDKKFWFLLFLLLALLVMLLLFFLLKRKEEKNGENNKNKTNGKNSKNGTNGKNGQKKSR